MKYPSRRARTIVALLSMLGAGSACNSGPTQADDQTIDDGLSYFPGASWRTASPRALHLDPDRIATMDQRLETGWYGSIHGVLIVRRGYLGYERYFGWSRDQRHTMQSVTKSVTSLLFGMLPDRDPVSAANLDRSVLAAFPRYPVVANVDQRKRDLTIRHLLTMRTGLDFWEQPYPGSPLDQLNRSNGDWTKFILDRPMTADPGTQWAYNSGAAILIGSLIRDEAGEDLVEFARRELFGPLGVTDERWVRSPFDGLPHTGGGLYLKPIDLARIGYLVLRHGAWNGSQVIPARWIDLSTQAVTRGPPVFFSSYGVGYGYFWWLFPRQVGGTDLSVIAASGSGGQWLFVVPSLDLVVAVVAENGNGLDLLYNEILPAVSE